MNVSNFAIAIIASNDTFSLDESFMHPRLLKVLVFQLHDIAVMLLSGESMEFDTVKH